MALHSVSIRLLCRPGGAARCGVRQGRRHAAPGLDAWSCSSRRVFCSDQLPARRDTKAHVSAKSGDTLPISTRDLIQALRISNSQAHELERAFRRYSAPGSPGHLSSAEVHALMADAAAERYSREDIDQAAAIFLRRFDTSGAGRVSLADFEVAVLQLSSHVDPRAYVLAMTIGVAFAGFSCSFPMGPTLIQTFGMTNLQFGMLTTTFAFAKLCWNIPSSILAERYGRKPLLVGGLCCIATGLGGVAAASCYEELLLLRLLVGTGVASTFTAAGMYITDISHPLNSARTRAPMQMGMSAGLLLGPAGGGYLLEHWGLQTTSVVVGLISLGTVLLASLVLPETLVHSGARRRTGGLMQTLQSWGPILQDKSFRRILSWGFCYNGAFFAAHALLPLAFVDLSLSPSVIGGVSTANAVVGLIATPIVARAADHFGKLAVVLPGAVLYGSCLILVPQATSLLELLPILATMQVGGAMCSQGQMHAMDQVGIRHRAKVPGLWNTFGDVGMLTTSAACATIAQLSGTTTAFQADGMFLLVATSVLFWVSRLR